MHYYKYSLTELDNMIPWEREVYISLIINAIEEETKQIRNNDV